MLYLCDSFVVGSARHGSEAVETEQCSSRLPSEGGLAGGHIASRGAEGLQSNLCCVEVGIQDRISVDHFNLHWLSLRESLEQQQQPVRARGGVSHMWATGWTALSLNHINTLLAEVTHAPNYIIFEYHFNLY